MGNHTELQRVPRTRCDEGWGTFHLPFASNRCCYTIWILDPYDALVRTHTVALQTQEKTEMRSGHCPRLIDGEPDEGSESKVKGAYIEHLSTPSFCKTGMYIFILCKSDQHWILIHLLQLNLAISLIQQLIQERSPKASPRGPRLKRTSPTELPPAAQMEDLTLGSQP